MGLSNDTWQSAGNCGWRCATVSFVRPGSGGRTETKSLSFAITDLFRCHVIGVLFGKIDGPGQWNKSNLNQCHLFLAKLTSKGRLYVMVAITDIWRREPEGRANIWRLSHFNGACGSSQKRLLCENVVGLGFAQYCLDTWRVLQQGTPKMMVCLVVSLSSEPGKCTHKTTSRPPSQSGGGANLTKAIVRLQRNRRSLGGGRPNAAAPGHDSATKAQNASRARTRRTVAKTVLLLDGSKSSKRQNLTGVQAIASATQVCLSVAVKK